MKISLFKPRKFSQRSGYTLIEIMLVLSIIAVLVAAAIGKLKGNLLVAQKQTVESDIQNISTQLKTYEMQALTLPTTEQGLDSLVHRPTHEPVPDKWTSLLEEVPKDPWRNPYQYLCPGKHNPDSFDLYSMGPDRTDGTDDDIGNWKNDK